MLFFVWVVQYGYVVDVLYQGIVGGCGQFGNYGVMGFVVFGGYFDFDQFVVFQDFVQFGQEGWCDFFVVDLQQGFQIMGVVVEEVGLG